MICPGCNKENIYEISVCVTCGTMMNDSVREELAMKITPIKKDSVKIEPVKTETVKKDPAPKIIIKEYPKVQEKTFQPKIKPSIQEPRPFIGENPVKPAKTTEISIKATSPTLVEFQNKNAPLPDWRLQLQNAVKQRQSENQRVEPAAAVAAPAVAPVEAVAPASSYPTRGSAALKVREVEINLPEEVADNAHLRNALARIESSRRRFLQNEPAESPEQFEGEESAGQTEQKPAVYQNNLRIATKDDKPAPISEEIKTNHDFPAKPTLVPAIAEAKIKDFYDTSELDPEFIPARISSSFEKRAAARPVRETRSEKEEISAEQKFDSANPKTQTNLKADFSAELPKKNPAIELEKIEKTGKTEIIEKIERARPAQKTERLETFEDFEVSENLEAEETEEEIVDDFAPFALRFNAGLFDLLIGSFLSLLLLSPFMLLSSGESWFTLTGFFAFLATCAIVMFLYQTISIGVFGKTFGMHLFALEMIDSDGEQYPSFHQAAVSSAVYLLSLAFLGMGFVTSFFDEDKRSVHDIVSGTLVVKEI